MVVALILGHQWCRSVIRRCRPCCRHYCERRCAVVWTHQVTPLLPLQPCRLLVLPLLRKSSQRTYRSFLPAGVTGASLYFPSDRMEVIEGLNGAKRLRGTPERRGGGTDVPPIITKEA